MSNTALILSCMSLLIASIFVPACFRDSSAVPATFNELQLALIKKVEITSNEEGGSARPEIAATPGRIFVLYLGNIQKPGDRFFGVKIYDRDVSHALSSRKLVVTSEYGGPTDIRIAADNNNLYSFYETFSESRHQTYLWGARYKLDDNFTRDCLTSTPIAVSRPLAELEDGGELLDDPCPLLGTNSVFVVTRLKYPVDIDGNTIYRVRELDPTLSRMLRQFDLDLSGKAHGRARVASLLFHDNMIYFALATTVSDYAAIDNDDAVKSDIILVKLKPDWNISSISTISADPGDCENYVCGLKTGGNAFYMAYRKLVGRPPQGEQRSQIKIYDLGLNLLHTELVKTAGWGPSSGEIRPSLEVCGNKIYSGQSSGKGIGSGNAEIYIYQLN